MCVFYSLDKIADLTSGISCISLLVRLDRAAGRCRERERERERDGVAKGVRPSASASVLVRYLRLSIGKRLLPTVTPPSPTPQTVNVVAQNIEGGKKHGGRLAQRIGTSVCSMQHLASRLRQSFPRVKSRVVLIQNVTT